MPTHIALDSHCEAFVREQVRSGRFSDMTAVVRAGLRLLEESEQRRLEQLAVLRSEVEAGLASGPAKDADAVFERLEARYRG